MNRIIKFRAWDEQEGEMYYYIKPNDFVAFSTALFNKIPIMQFTGLKDCKNKDIYEGDILGRIYRPPFSKPDGTMERSVVIYKKDQFIGNRDTPSETGIQYFISNPHPYYVIGNIYENPELL